MVNLKKLNEELNKINENLFIKVSSEDYCEQDKEEYGIQNLKETIHLSLQYWNKKGTQSTLIKEHFDFKAPLSLMFSETQLNKMKELGMSTETAFKVTTLLWKHQK